MNQNNAEHPKKKFKKDSSNETKRLESLLFGGDTELLNKLDVLTGDTQTQKTSWADTRSQESKNSEVWADDQFADKENTQSIEPIITEKKRAAAWVDDDDDLGNINIDEVGRLRYLKSSEEETAITSKEYISRLRKNYDQINYSGTWAELPPEQTAETGADKLISNILSTNDALTFQGTSRRVGAAASLSELPKGKIDLLRLTDANKADYSNHAIYSAKFHPNGELFMTAGADKTIRLFQIDGELNPKIQGVHLSDMPVMCANFNHDGTEIIASGKRRYIYTYDLQHGAVTKLPPFPNRPEKTYQHFKISPDGVMIAFIGMDGHILLVSMKTKQVIDTLKSSAIVNDLDFSPDSKLLYTVGMDGFIYTWDIGSRRCIKRYSDDGAVHGMCIAASSDGKYIASGSDSGVANLYSTSSEDEKADIYGGNKKTPLKALLPLTTSISSLKFAKSGEILALGSREKKNAVRLVHLPSMTVFDNWPTSQTRTDLVLDIDFSPHSGMMSIANERGKVLLYRINHYQSS